MDDKIWRQKLCNAIAVKKTVLKFSCTNLRNKKKTITKKAKSLAASSKFKAKFHFPDLASAAPLIGWPEPRRRVAKIDMKYTAQKSKVKTTNILNCIAH